MSAEMMRLLENVIRVGVVTEIDATGGTVRITTGGLLTNWIRWQTQRAGAFKIWCPPKIGEQVLIVCAGGNPETAFVIGSLYGEENKSPSSSLKEVVLTAPDGAVIRYDAAAGLLDVTGIKNAHIQASVGVTLETPKVECTQHLKARTFEFTNGGTIAGNVTHSGGSMTSNGVVAHTHQHGGVKGGGDMSGGPQ